MRNPSLKGDGGGGGAGRWEGGLGEWAKLDRY